MNQLQFFTLSSGRGDQQAVLGRAQALRTRDWECSWQRRPQLLPYPHHY